MSIEPADSQSPLPRVIPYFASQTNHTAHMEVAGNQSAKDETSQHCQPPALLAGQLNNSFGWLPSLPKGANNQIAKHVPRNSTATFTEHLAQCPLLNRYLQGNAFWVV